MEKLSTFKKYEDFNTFYNAGYDLAQTVKDLTKGQSALQRVAFARNYIEREILNGCIDIGYLSNDVMRELETSSEILKFSIDNIVKNCIAHSDVCYEDYLKIPEIAKNPSKILKSKNGYDVMLFKEKEKYYKLVIKTTKNKDENFVKSFHLLRAKRYHQYK